MKKITPSSNEFKYNFSGGEVQVRMQGGSEEESERVQKTVAALLAQPLASSSSSTRKTVPSDVHNGKNIYFIRAAPASRFVQMSGSEISTRIVIRMTEDLFSAQEREAMEESDVKNAKECRHLDEEPNLAKFDIDQIIDIYQDPAKPGMCKAYQIQDIAFTKMMKKTPTSFVKMVKEGLCKQQSFVSVVEKGKTGFQQNTHVNNQAVYKRIESRPGPADAEIAKTLFSELTAERDVKRKQGQFENVLSEVLGTNPILPEEKIFTGFKALAYRKNDPSNSLDPFYQVIDAIEFRMRQYCAATQVDVKELQALAHFIGEELTRFPQKNRALTKIYEALQAMHDVISIVQSDKYSKDFAPTVHEFLMQILHRPLREQLKCTVSTQNVRRVATENLTLRSSLLLSQFKSSLQGICSKELLDLERIDAAFRRDDWVTANALLCDVMASDFFKGITTEMPPNFADQKAFAPYKFAAGIVSLVDFFNEVVKASDQYQWINFSAVKESFQYLTQPEKASEKGKLALLGQWVQKLHDAGYTELGEESKQLNGSLQKFSELKKKFEADNKDQFSNWLKRVQNKEIDPKEYQDLCQKIDQFYREIDQALTEISHHVNMVQALIVLLAGKKGIPPIDQKELAQQLAHLNNKIKDTCLPFVYFMHNFKMLMVQKQTAPKAYALTSFETNPAKLFRLGDVFQDIEDDAEVRVMDDSGDEAPLPVANERSPEMGDTLGEELKEVFSTNNRRKILENLNAFFKEHKQKVKIEGGKGSHIKIYLGKVPIVIPHSQELKVGTAGSIRNDILEELRKLA